MSNLMSRAVVHDVADAQRFLSVRAFTEELAAPLSAEEKKRLETLMEATPR